MPQIPGCDLDIAPSSDMTNTIPKQVGCCTSLLFNHSVSGNVRTNDLDNLVFVGAINGYYNKKQYLEIKTKANRAIKTNKIFFIYGNCEPVRTALINRGWIEKLPLNRNRVTNKKSQLSLERILLSNLVAKAPPNFIWKTKEDLMLEENHRFFKGKFNRLEISYLWSSKQGLCAALQNERWYYKEDTAEVSSPRTYSCADKIDLIDLKNDFKLTACSSLLKWFVSMVETKDQIFQESGNISMNVIVFAINRCKEYIYRKRNKDIDKQIPSRPNCQWNAFLKNYYALIERRDAFKRVKDNKAPLFLTYAKFLLHEMNKYRRQLSCEGYHNIWIIKPAHCNRGWGIKLTSKLDVLIDSTNKGKYIAQKYIEEPLLIFDTKFDVRLYYLVTSACPLEIWMYKDCYLKFSSQKYSIIDYDESIHLTNNAVQKKYENCKDRHPLLPPHNMWHSDTFKEYLRSFGKDDVWDTIIYPGMKKSIVAVMTNYQDSITHCVKNRFELFGCDFILDKSYRPWLIEINSSPDVNPTTPVTEKLCPEVLSDVIRVVVDYANSANHSLGRFECIYRETRSPPAIDAEIDQNLRVRGHALPYDYFYRGRRKLVETNSLASDAKQEDVSAILKTLKTLHDDDIMKESINNNLHLAENQIKLPTDVDGHKIKSIDSGNGNGVPNLTKKPERKKTNENSKIRFNSQEGDERLISIKDKLYSFLNKLDQI